MKINLECIKDILIYLEENLVIDKESVMTGHYRFKSISSQTLCKETALKNKYTEHEIFYSVLKMNEKGLIECKLYNNLNYIIEIIDITWQGHEYLKSLLEQK